MDEHQTAQKALRPTQGGVAFIQLADELATETKTRIVK